MMTVEMHGVLRVASLIALAYVGFGVLLYLTQSRFVYYPSHDVSVTPEAFQVPYEDLRLNTSDGEKIGAWYVPYEGAALTAVFFHGNGGNLGEWLDTVLTLRGMRLNVLAIDYHGYGNSSGKPSESGTHLDALAAWDYLTLERGVSAERIVVYGRSLGGAVACRLAAVKKPGGLILESTFTSAGEMAARRFPYMPARLLCRFDYDSLSRMPDVHCPVFIAHGRKDSMVPFEHGRKLFEAAAEPKQFAELAGDHNDGTIEADRAYRSKVMEFMAKHVVGKE